jgi:diaminopimelate decarboxylase
MNLNMSSHSKISISSTSFTPRYEYSRSVIQERIDLLKSLTAPYGLIVRYAVKANPYPEILAMMNKSGIHFDASSSYEAQELLEQGVSGSAISLSSQQTPHNLKELLDAGVLFTATSINQLKLFIDWYRANSRTSLNTEHVSNVSNISNTVAVRINPDVGYGHNKRTSTGGINSSFGIWHEYIGELLALTSSAGVVINRLHIHVGSGADPSIWGEVMERSLQIARQFPDVNSLDIGGGYKVHRFGDEKEADMQAIAQIFSEKLTQFFKDTGRKLQLEIEPGTYFIAHAGVLVARVDDIVDTGTDGYTFLKLNTGMNDFLRSGMYGARHKIEIVNGKSSSGSDVADVLSVGARGVPSDIFSSKYKKDEVSMKEYPMKEYIVVGHNCESGDILTPAQGNPEEIEPRLLREAHIGDEVRIYDVGAYCASMRAKGYNSFPDAIEVMVD